MEIKTKGFQEMTQQEMETTEGGLKAIQTIVMGIHKIFGNTFKGLFNGLFGAFGVGGSSDAVCGGKYTNCYGSYHGEDCDLG